MARAFSPKVLTANDLRSGEVIYATAYGLWSDALSDAELLTTQSYAQTRLDEALANGNLIGPYLADAKPGRHGPEPVHFREAFRAQGPSNHFHGKQANTRNTASAA